MNKALMPFVKRSPFLSILLSVVALMASATGVLAKGAKGGAPASVSRSDASTVVFRVDLEPYTRRASGAVAGTERYQIPGFSARGNPGEPATYSRQFYVALPPTGNYTVTHRAITSESIGNIRIEPMPFPEIQRDHVLGDIAIDTYRFDAAVYNGYRPPAVVEPFEPVWIRRNRALPIMVNPLQFNPVTGQATLVTSIEVTVTFRDAANGKPSAPARPESRIWDGVRARLMVNAKQAAEWREPSRFSSQSVYSSASQLQGTHIKLHVTTTELHRVTAATAIAAGFPSGQPLTSLHLFQRTYDDNNHTVGTTNVAYTVVEDGSGTPNFFDANDQLIFYGRRLRDDAAQGDTVEKYSRYNVYWLGTTGGPSMVIRNPAAGSVSPDTATASFPVNRHFEEDTNFWEQIKPQNGVDYYMYNTSNETTFDVLMDLDWIAPGTSMTIQAQLHGKSYNQPVRQVGLSLVNAIGTNFMNNAFFVRNKDLEIFSHSVTDNLLVPGANTFRITRGGGGTISVYCNWVRVSYAALFRARSNRLQFNTESLSGQRDVTVTGITSTNLVLFDITDPLMPERLTVTGAMFADVGGSQAMSFNDDADANRHYVLTPLIDIKEIAAADVALDTPSSIIAPTVNNVDILVVAHATFVSQMQQWATYRRAQGFSVILVDAQDVYDEFNNGVPGTRGIDRFVKRFYDLASASALVLVGDHSEDNKRVHSTSGFNFVPSHSYSEHVGSGINADEVVTTDKRYVLMPNPGGGTDTVPDMIVGRIPVGSANELTIVLQKIFRFEEPRATDLWRKRIIIIADDTYSVGSSQFGGLANLCPSGAEVAFQTGQEATALIIEGSLPAGYDVVRYYLGEKLDPFTTDGECQIFSTRVALAREHATPGLMNELAMGATLVTAQAHMNQSQITHESVFTTLGSGALGIQGPARDHLRMGNDGRPFIMFGMGCHFSDYALHKEEGRIGSNTPNGDSFAEQLLFANNRGAVSTYGSSGWEFLNQTNAFMDRTMRIWFNESPYDDTIEQTNGQWIFGQLMFIVEASLALSQVNPIQRYHILGDPMLHIDAGPPAFDVTVDGNPFNSGDVVLGGGRANTIDVNAIVTDENALFEFELEIAGVDLTDSLVVTRLSDPTITNARQYNLAFSHELRPETYDIILRALQAPDTSGGYHMVAEFILRVQTSVELTVNGRPITSGDAVPGKGDYRAVLAFPVFVPESEISVMIDDEVVTNVVASHPTPQDSTTWLLDFTADLSDGVHTLVIAAGTNRFTYQLVVNSIVGLRNLINYPNPFGVDGTSIVYDTDFEISEGSIDVFTTSGRRIRRLLIPPEARSVGQNVVFWDGRDAAGDEIANGIYLYVINVTQRGEKMTIRGKMSRMR